MNFFNYILLVGSAASFVAGKRNVIQYEMEKLENNEDLKIETWWKEKIYTDMKWPNTKLQAFSWKDCGDDKSLATIKDLKISPDPVVAPGTLHISAAVKVKSLLDNLKGHVTMYKKIAGSWAKVPCIEGFGTCSYDSVCALLSQIPQCPDPLEKIGLNCRCPIKPKLYALTDATFDIMASALPFGDFHIIGNITTQTGQAAVCLDVYVSFAS